ncbi:histidine phosphatase family protein [Occultella aeris]|uniref:Phosphoserine phosphatase 1 n=1 Tax=Occultella aeris TaxID=2761496 RepID=A0A7M4DHE2_9MICO|nr:histidine phosphatase family protein [Occultella aeris]VZO36335.1 Phosphoserine phosphatase 1 [Occultella aeris]
MVTGWAIDEPLLEQDSLRLRVVLVRHGESGWNGEGRIQGHLGGGLTDRGRDQAATTADFLTRAYRVPDAVLASDLPRVLQTAAPYADRLPGAIALRPDPRLREVDNGTWSGRLIADVASAEADAIERIRGGQDLPRGGGERMAELSARVQSAIADLAAETAQEHPAGERLVVAFSHGGPIRMATVAAVGLPPSGYRAVRGAGNCSVTELEYWVGTDGSVLASRLVSANSAHHLGAGAGAAPTD